MRELEKESIELVDATLLAEAVGVVKVSTMTNGYKEMCTNVFLVLRWWAWQHWEW